MGCVQSYFRKAHNAGLSPSSTHGSEKAGIPQDPTADVANLVDSPEKEPLDITDLQNDGELNLAGKQNESAPELNGTVKADDGDAGKLTAAATGTAAVIGVATGVALVNTHNEDSKELPEETEAITQSGSASISVSPAPVDSEADTAEVTEDGEAKSPLSVESGREAVDVVSKSGAKGEPEDSGSVSTLIPEDTPKSRVESSTEPVPEAKPYTAKLDETPEQGSRPSASQIVINEDYVDSKSTSAAVDGTRPTSASLIEGETVPEQKQEVETSLSPTGKESPNSRPQSTMEQGTESPEGSRPFSATETRKQARRPESSISLSKDEAESAIEAIDVAQVDSLPASTVEIMDRPASGPQETEETKMTIGSVSEDDNSSRSVAESSKEEEAGKAGSAVDNIEFSERVEDSRPDNVAVSIREGGNRPLSSSELTKQEGSRPMISEVDNADVSEEPARSRPISSVKSAEEEEGNVAAENTEFEKTAEISSINANELEDSERRPDILLADTIEDSKETAGSRPVSATEYTAEDGTRPVNDSQLIKEEGNAVSGKVEMSQDTIGSPPINADELEAGGRIPENSTVSSLQNSVETADVLPVNVAESTKEVGIRSLSATESNKGNEARSVSSTVDGVNITEEAARSRLVTADESTEEEGNRPASTTDKNLEEERPIDAAISGNFEGSEPNSVAGEEVSEKPVEYRPVSNSSEEKDNRLVEAKDPTKDNESKTVTVSEIVKMEETESSTVESVDVSEDRLGNQPISLAYTTEGEESLPDSAAIPTEEAKSRPTSSTVEEAVVVEQGESQTSAKEGNIPESAVESTEEVSTLASDVGTTKEDKNISASTAESTKEGRGNRPLSTTDLTEQERSRPSSVASAVKEEGSRPTSASEPRKDEVSNPVSAENSTKDEEIKSAKEESNRSAITLGFTEEESRPDSTVEWNKASGSTRDEGSRPSSVVAEAADLTETLHKIRDSAPDSFTEQGSIPESSATENADNSAEVEGTRPVNATESAEEGYRPVTSVIVEKSFSAELGEPEVENESTEVSAEPTEDVQTAKGPTVLADTEQETVNTASQPSSSLPLSTGIQEKSEDEAGNDSRPPTASPSVGAEIVAEASEKEESSSNAVRGTTETESPAYSVNAQTDDIPSLTGTDAAVEPVLEDKLTEDEEKPAAGNMEEKDTAEEEAKELNRAATTIQATFRGYQARQTLSKTAENYEVPESMTSHDFLFGPPVQQSVGKGPRNRETGEDQQADSELAELQKPQECDEIHATQEGASNDASDADSSVSTAATKIQAGVRGFLTRRHVQNMKTSNSTTAPSIGDSQKSLGDPLTSQEVEDEGVHTSGSMETEVQKQQQETLNDESQEAVFTTEKVGVKTVLSLDSQLDGKVQRPVGSRTAVSLQLDGPVNEDEDRQVWQTLQQEELDEAAIKIQSNYRGYRMRRSLKREDAVQMPTTSTSTFTASSDVIPDSVRHSGEFHDMIVLPPSTEEDLTDASAQNHVATASSTPLQPSDDVTSPAGNQETDMTEASQGGEAKMDGKGEATAAEAATKIQASYRGFRTRQDIKTANTAASKIQAGFRGYKVRKQLRENNEDKKNGPRNQGSRPQSVNHKEEVEAANQTPAGDVEERSATKIQASVRGYLVRRRRQVERDAAVKIQAGFRGYQTRRGLKARQQQQQK